MNKNPSHVFKPRNVKLKEVYHLQFKITKLFRELNKCKNSIKRTNLEFSTKKKKIEINTTTIPFSVLTKISAKYTQWRIHEGDSPPQSKKID